MDSISQLLAIYRRRMEQLVSVAPLDVQPELQHMIPSLGPAAISEIDLVNFQQKLPFQLPQSFVAFLRGPAVEDYLEWQELIVSGNVDVSEWDSLLSLEEFWKIGLARVASGPCGDPVCFDIYRVQSDGEYPIVVINHDWVSPQEWESAEAVRQYVSVEFASFYDLLKTVCEGLPVKYKRFGKTITR